MLANIWGKQCGSWNTSPAYKEKLSAILKGKREMGCDLGLNSLDSFCIALGRLGHAMVGEKITLEVSVTQQNISLISCPGSAAVCRGLHFLHNPVHKVHPPAVYLLSVTMGEEKFVMSHHH